MKELKFDFYDKTNLKSYNLDNSMQYQLAVLNSLDLFTRKHSENVANITCRICEYMHMPNYFITYCTICAYLHDIGKQFIPPEILQKPSKLTDEEYEVIKTHTTLGYNICMKNPKLSPYSAGTIYHHEALDGSGYPNHITKDSIPIEGQIIRVADEFDAITSKRQYKSHINICETLQILIDEAKPSGHNKLSKINPKVLKALLKVVADDTEYELYNLGLYVDYLENEIKRLKQIEVLEEKMNKSSNSENKSYYLEEIKRLLSFGENQDNYKLVMQDYIKAYNLRNDQVKTLNSEFKKIKKMKV